MLKVEELVKKDENEIKKTLKKIIVDKSLEFDWDDFNLQYNRAINNELFSYDEEDITQEEDLDEILNFANIADYEENDDYYENILFTKNGNDLIFAFRESKYIFCSKESIIKVLEDILSAINVIKEAYNIKNNDEFEKEKTLNDFFNVDEDIKKVESLEAIEIKNDLL